MPRRNPHVSDRRSTERVAPARASPQLAVLKHLLLLGAFLHREGTRVLASHSLNQQQFVVLKEIQERGAVLQKELCSALLFEKSNVSKIVARLGQLRLINVTVPPDDARKTTISMTPHGQALVARAMADLDRWNAQWLSVLDDKEASTTAAALAKLRRSTTAVPRR
jgi:DNA-binding MarR family transcriptional regulator